MLEIVILLVVALVLLITSAVGFGAPFLPTLRDNAQQALDLLDLKPGQTMLELGSGDGRMLRAAARRGIYAVGYEINPILFVYSWLLSWPQRKYIRIHLRSYWSANLPKADGVYVFLLQKYMPKLHQKMLQYLSQQGQKSIKLVSFSFKFENLKPVQQTKALFLYKIKV